MSKPTTGDFTKTVGWLDWYTGPAKPTFQLPAGAVDAHCHVFGPGAEFPYAPERLTVATPRALPPDDRQASTIARLSAPWQVACTITLRAKPRWSRSANSSCLLASQGVYLRSGA